tara:strand:+ start:5860 stop:7452 length:1593 start_codon:yes stop_codon:yes gene_type:complete
MTQIFNNGGQILTTATDGSGSGLTVNVFIQWNSEFAWRAEWSIVNEGDGYKTGDTISFGRPSGLPNAAIFPDGAMFNVTAIDLPDLLPIEDATEEGDSAILKGNLNQFDAVADYVQFPDMETKSHQDGPEHEIVYVNEQIDPGYGKALYPELAIGGIRINSAKEWTNFTQLSAYFKKGIKVDDLINGGDKKASNNFVEIANALLTDSTLGAGELIGANAVGDLSIAAKFCEKNNFTWDGVISNKINLRDFLHEHGTYNLLDFTVVGGKFNLIPAVPHDTEYKIQRNKKIEVSALFTDGNIKDLQVSFLSPEERQLFKANVLYREEQENGFAETKSLIIRLIDTQGGSRTDPLETYDLSGFCTSREHARMYAQYILKLRKEIDHGLKFQTAPQYVVNLTPGDYFRLVSEATHVQRYDNGVVTKEGQVISKDIITDTNASIYYWEVGTSVEKVKEANGVNFVTGAGLPRGVLFTLKNAVTSNRVYKVETISYSEDGLIEVSGSHAPLTSTGSLAILEGWDGTSPFNHFEEVI